MLKRYYGSKKICSLCIHPSSHVLQASLTSLLKKDSSMGRRSWNVIVEDTIMFCLHAVIFLDQTCITMETARSG